MKENNKDFFEEIKKEFKDIGGKVNRMFEEMVKGKKNDKAFELSADVFESVDGLVFEIDLPGFQKKDVIVQMRENNLIVRGERSRAEAAETLKFHLNERSFGPFERSFSLPEGIEPTGIKAKFDNGVLRVIVPVQDKVVTTEKTVSIE